MSCDRCTVWLRVKKEDWPKARDLIEEDSGHEPCDELSDEGPGWEEWMYEDVRYPDDLLACLEKAGIPYRSVNSAGEYPEAACMCIAGETRLAPMLDSDFVIRIDPDTNELDGCSMNNFREYRKLEEKFYDYCEKGTEHV